MYTTPSLKAQSLLSQWTSHQSGLQFELLMTLGGVLLVSILAQISIAVPFSPVPITGQTFAVSLIGFFWGRRAPIVLTSYLALGFLGAPIFALGKSGLIFGPTFGYLLGMVFSSILIGYLSERGWGKSFIKALVANFMGSLLIFFCGLCVLSYFLPKESLFIAGLIPFLPGDLIKNVISATLVTKLNNKYLTRDI
ncbi:MAG: biotin transporter BioY [Bdellovibrionales bacterium]|nr:biotin transporter BioY [Bdellovibrionales bacterium]